MSKKRRPHLWIVRHRARNRWQVVVRVQGRQFFVGSFKALENAFVARNLWLKVTYGGLGEAWRLRKKTKKRGLSLEDMQRGLQKEEKREEQEQEKQEEPQLQPQPRAEGLLGKIEQMLEEKGAENG